MMLTLIVRMMMMRMMMMMMGVVKMILYFYKKLQILGAVYMMLFFLYILSLSPSEEIMVKPFSTTHHLILLTVSLPFAMQKKVQPKLADCD